MIGSIAPERESSSSLSSISRWASAFLSGPRCARPSATTASFPLNSIPTRSPSW
ncbi:hypothetical protein KSP39_PZI023946 [Platanthera zijinensis]|uniref:Uncharacterized protein n=1 Tax=Platanthera zijinensis TaxID=2320716 RepID=A0AAP0FTE7_9ASPA